MYATCGKSSGVECLPDKCETLVCCSLTKVQNRSKNSIFGISDFTCTMFMRLRSKAPVDAAYSLWLSFLSLLPGRFRAHKFADDDLVSPEKPA